MEVLTTAKELYGVFRKAESERRESGGGGGGGAGGAGLHEGGGEDGIEARARSLRKVNEVAQLRVVLHLKGTAVQVAPIKPTLKAPGCLGTKRLKLKCGEPPSNFAFNFKLRRYTKVRT